MLTTLQTKARSLKTGGGLKNGYRAKRGDLKTGIVVEVKKKSF